MRRYPSPSLVISIIALVVALGGAGYSATGGNFILGRSNLATTGTLLEANINARTLVLRNFHSGTAATPLALVAAAGHPPLTVNSSARVPLLNADKLDGLDSNQFPRTLVIPYNLAPGANSAAITVPPNRPVFVMGIIASGNKRGVGQATLQRIPGALLAWVGVESNPTAVTHGISSAAGTHIVDIDWDNEVDIQVNSADTIRIHNAAGQTHAGTVTLIW